MLGSLCKFFVTLGSNFLSCNCDKYHTGKAMCLLMFAEVPMRAPEAFVVLFRTAPRQLRVHVDRYLHLGEVILKALTSCKLCCDNLSRLDHIVLTNLLHLATGPSSKASLRCQHLAYGTQDPCIAQDDDGL